MSQPAKFASLFRKYRLQSGCKTLADLGNVLAEKGEVFEDSSFSRWQTGARIPKNRQIILSLLRVFIKKRAIFSLDQAQEFLQAASQGFLTDREVALLPKLVASIPFQVPRLFRHFIERKPYFQQVSLALTSGQTVLLSGPAGIGKTSLAIHLGYALRKVFPDGVLWFRLDTTPTMDILLAIARSYGEDIGSVKNLQARAALVRSLLANKKALLIFDNAEHERQIFSLATFPCSVLITSRQRFLNTSSIDTTVLLQSFDIRESFSLLRLVLGKKFVAQHRKELANITALLGNLPLAVHLVAKQLSLGKDLPGLQSQLSDGFPLTRFRYSDGSLYKAFEGSFHQLSNKQKAIFLSLAVFMGKDFSPAAVAFIDTIPHTKAAEVLDALVNQSLLEYSFHGRYRLHPMIKSFIGQKLKAPHLYPKAARYYQDFLQQGGRGTFQFYPKIEEELDNILGIFVACFKRGFYKEVIGLWEFLGIFLWDTGRWHDMKKYSSIFCKACRETNNKQALAQCFIRELCWLYYWQGNIEKAQFYVQEGMKLAKELHDKALLALGWIRLGKIYQSKRMGSKAHQLFKKALGYYKRVDNQEKQGDILTYIGETQWIKGKQRMAEKYLSCALSKVNEIQDLPQKITILSRLGCIALQEKHLSRAIAYFKKSLLVEKKSGRRVGDTFWNNLALGLTYEALGNRTVARKKFELAKKEMVFVGFTERILDVDVFPLIFKDELRKSSFFRTRS